LGEAFLRDVWCVWGATLCSPFVVLLGVYLNLDQCISFIIDFLVISLSFLCIGLHSELKGKELSALHLGLMLPVHSKGLELDRNTMLWQPEYKPARHTWIK
jgi:hypothetical protein